jgi:hypothetical protein
MIPIFIVSAVFILETFYIIYKEKRIENGIWKRYKNR